MTGHYRPGTRHTAAAAAPSLPRRLRPQVAWAARLLLAVLAFLGPSAGRAAREVPRPGAFERVIAKVVCQMIPRHHYSRKMLDDELSNKIFDSYFDRLDHNRSFFLAADIDSFATYRFILDDLLLRGNADFAYDVYELFVKRVRERVEYTRRRLEEPFDFGVEEAMPLDRSEEPWCVDREALDEVWRLRVKNNLLNYQLMTEALEAKEPEAAVKHQTAEDGTEGEAPGPDETPPPAPGPNADGDKAETTDEADGAAADGGGSKPATTVTKRTPKERVIRFYERYLRQMEENEAIDILEIFLTSMGRVYDPHSVYMAPSTEEDFDIQMKLSLQGIGALLTTEDIYTKVAGIIPGGPADSDGRLKEGDRIIAVAQGAAESVDVIDMPLRKVVKLIRGKKGTTVALTVIEAGKGLGSGPVVIDIVRDQVKLKEQEARSEIRPIELPPAEEGGESGKASVLIAYLPSFYSDFEAKHKGEKDYKSSTRDVRRLLEEAKANGNLDGMVLDLRSNGGGSLDEAIDLAGLFFPSGPVVQVRQATRALKKRFDEDGVTYYDGPLVVLVNRLSASASEIVAGAIQDYHRGVIVGEKSTHGKGTVQTVYHLNRRMRNSPLFRNKRSGSLKFTMAKFYRVTGASTQQHGVTPDIILPSFTDHMKLGEAHLPNVMPWDEIEPLEIERTVDIQPFVPHLQEKSRQRLDSSEQFVQLRGEIDRFGERRKQKMITLNKAKRLELQKEEEQWSEKIRRLKPRKRKAAPDKKDGDAPPEDVKDYFLTEALSVLGDLILAQGTGDEVLLSRPSTTEPDQAGSGEAAASTRAD